MKMKNFFHFEQRHLRVVILSLLAVICWLEPSLDMGTAYAQTAQGELEGRPAPVFRRKCVGGPNAGNLCNQGGNCPSSTCPDRNIFNISVAVQFNATNAEIATIQNLISEGSAVLFDVTDGQAEIGEAFIYNNAFGTGSDADLRIYPDTYPVWWQANTGSWQLGGSIHVSINHVNSAPSLGESFAHEFVHLVFDARDEYESRAAGCGSLSGSARCPDAAAIEAGQASCLMDQGGVGGGDFSELCWGQGNPLDTTDITGGNHDATNVTEQSRCRSNRSCWAQVVWSWPNTFLAPEGAPDPDANDAVVNTTRFVKANSTTRVVLVLDESGSMSLESPSRLERLKVAAKDFIALAENGTELGIVSYSDDAEADSGRVNVAIAPLGADRTTWNNAINDLAPTAWTNIGAGLQKAKDMIIAAGGVTANTFIVLMSDGINNRPAPQSNADADLQAKINDLMISGIPVYVTCTGGDLGLSSQCSEIAAGTGGFYVDSADSARLAEAFVDIHERISRRDSVSSFSSWLNEKDDIFFVEEGCESATFTLIWQKLNMEVSMAVIDPNGNQYGGKMMPQGEFVRVMNPVPGFWKMNIDWSGEQPDRYVKRLYSRNPIHSLAASPRYASVLPGEAIYIFAYPRSFGGSVTGKTKRIVGLVLRPDGSEDVIELNDMGHSLQDGGDDIANDGIYTGVYKNTKEKGPYQFLLRADIDKWQQSEEIEKRDPNIVSAKFVREVRVSAAVGDPNDKVKTPEDTPNKIEWCKCLRLSLHGGMTFPITDFGSRYNGSYMFAVDMDYHFSPQLSAVALLGFNHFRVKPNYLPDYQDTYWWNLSANLKWELSTNPLRPYVNGGFGLYMPKTGSIRPGFNLGFGLDHTLNPNLVLEAGMDYHHILTPQEDPEFYTTHIGLILRF